MKSLLDNLVIDLIAAVLTTGMAATGYVLRFPLPPGSNKSLSLWGLTRHQWGDVHFWISLALLGVILLHLVQHWQWVAISVRRKLSAAKVVPGPGWLSGLLTLLTLGAVLTVFAWAAHHGVVWIAEPDEGACRAPLPAGTKERSAEGDSSPGTGTWGGRLPLAFWKDVHPLLERSCVPCHGPQKQRGAFRADRRGDYFGTADGVALVVAGKSAESPLVDIVSGQKDIPRPDVHVLPADKVEVLRAWIDAGAAWPEHPPSPE